MPMRRLLILLLATTLHAQVTFSGATSISGASSLVTNGQYMTVLGSNKYLTNTQTGHPVFITGDAPQLGMVQIQNGDWQTYLADRASRGFNALWIYPIDAVDQTGAPNNAYGNAPFSGGDFLGMSSQTAYWANVDMVVQQAQQDGITLWMNAAFVGLNSADGYLTSLQNASCGTLTSYGNFLGARYAKYPNIVWVLGGDWDPSTLNVSQLQCIAGGIKADDPNHLLTVEVCRVCTPANQSSMDAWSGSTAINLNWVYAPYASMQASCASNYARSGALPALAGEDWYENEHSMTALQIREEAYWEVLSGCTLGRLFGNNPIWCMNTGSAIDSCGATNWLTYLGSAGSLAEEYQGQLMRSRKFWLMAPDSSNVVLTGGIGSGSTISVASCTSDSQTCIVYDPTGNSQAPQIAMAHWSGTVHAYWFNPSSGAVTDLSTFTNSGTHTFTPSDGNDWTLVLDLNSASLCSPGTCVQ